MGIVVKVRTIAKPDTFFCSTYACLHNWDMECRREKGPKLDKNGYCLIIENTEQEDT